MGGIDCFIYSGMLSSVICLKDAGAKVEPEKEDG